MATWESVKRLKDADDQEGPREGPIVLDGGVRRGPDIFKAVALGATAVGIGRPCTWGDSARSARKAWRRS